MTLLEELKEAHPEKEIIAIEVYFIDGVLHVPKLFLSKHMGVSERSIGSWQKKGLEISEYSLPNFNLYDWEYVKKWYRLNIDQKQSVRRRGKS